MKFKKKYTSEELNKIYLDFKESKLSKYAFVKKHKIGSSTIYKAISLNESRQKDKTNIEDTLASNVMLLEVKEHIDRKFLSYHSDAIKSLKAEINSKISDVLFKFTLFLLAAQFVFTMILLFFLS
jgi:hypothetical protein